MPICKHTVLIAYMHRTAHLPVQLLASILPEPQLHALLATLPRHWEVLGDVCLLPSDAFEMSPWTELFAQHPSLPLSLWKAVAEALSVERVARQREIATEVTRDSRVEMLLGTDGWVQHKENGIIYEFDITKSMFASGNGTGWGVTTRRG